MESSACLLRLFLEKLGRYEPGLVDLIQSFVPDTVRVGIYQLDSNTSLRNQKLCKYLYPSCYTCNYLQADSLCSCHLLCRHFYPDIKPVICLASRYELPKAVVTGCLQIKFTFMKELPIKEDQQLISFIQRHRNRRHLNRVIFCIPKNIEGIDSWFRRHNNRRTTTIFVSNNSYSNMKTKLKTRNYIYIVPSTKWLTDSANDHQFLKKMTVEQQKKIEQIQLKLKVNTEIVRTINRRIMNRKIQNRRL